MKKLPYLDFAKGVCMLFIIYGHLCPYPASPIMLYIYSFHVTAFYIISGILIEHTQEYNKPIKHILKTNILRTIVPYLCFGFIYILVFCYFWGFNNISWLVQQNLLFIDSSTATWFLPVLFSSKLYIILLRKLFKSNSLFTLSCITPFAIALFSCFTYPSEHYCLYIIFRSFNAIGFIWIGMSLHKYLERFTSSNIVLIATLLISILGSQYNGRISTYSMLYRNSIIYVLVAIAGTFFWLCIGKRFTFPKIISLYGVNSIIVLGTHQTIIFIISAFFGKDFINLNWFLLFLVIVLIEILLFKIINQFFPFIIGKPYQKHK